MTIHIVLLRNGHKIYSRDRFFLVTSIDVLQMGVDYENDVDWVENGNLAVKQHLQMGIGGSQLRVAVKYWNSHQMEL